MIGLHKVTHVQTPNGRYVAVSTADTFDAGWETMVFRSDSHEILDFDDLDRMNYNSRQEAEAGHQKMIEKWKRTSLIP